MGMVSLLICGLVFMLCVSVRIDDLFITLSTMVTMSILPPHPPPQLDLYVIFKVLDDLAAQCKH